MSYKRNISINFEHEISSEEREALSLNYMFDKDCIIKHIAFEDIENGSQIEVYKPLNVAGKVLIPKASSNINNIPIDGNYIPKPINFKVKKNEMLTGELKTINKEVNGEMIYGGTVVVAINVEIEE